VKLLVIGNSHCNPVKHASDAPGGPFQGDLTFMTSPGHDLDLVIENGVVTCVSERAFGTFADGVSQSQVVIDEYDAIVVVGLNLLSSQALRLHSRGYRVFPHEARGKVLLSQAAYAAALTGLLESCQAIRTATLLRGHSDKPIILVPQPMPLTRISEPPGDDAYRKGLADKWRPFLTDPLLGQALQQMFEQALTRLAEASAFQVAFQPAETRDGLFTRPDYQLLFKGPFHKATRQPLGRTDFTHMNDAYGLVILQQLQALLCPPPAEPEPPPAPSAQTKAAKPAKRGKTSSDR